MGTFPPPTPQAATVDVERAERLARLAARRSATAPPAGNPSPTRSVGAPAGRSSGRRHPAATSRAVALALSVGTTVGLANFFRVIDAHANRSLDAASPAGSSTASSAGAASAGTASAGTASAADLSAVTPSASIDAATATAATSASASSVSSAPTAAPATTAAAALVEPQATAAGTVPAAGTAGASTGGSVGASNETVGNAAARTGLADGTYTGDTFTNRWGPVQVQITVAGGAITAVSTLQTPDSRRKSVAINDRAVPRLVTSTLKAQSAAVDSVSGATYTSVGYRQSLQTAIDDARAAAVG